MWLLAGTIASAAEQTKNAAPAVPHHITIGWMSLGILVATVATWLIFRWRSASLKRRLHSPRRLLRDLFRLHQLGWSERWLFMTLARNQKLSEPARLFLEPDLWRPAIEAELSPGRKQRLVALQAKLLKT